MKTRSTLLGGAALVVLLGSAVPGRAAEKGDTSAGQRARGTEEGAQAASASGAQDMVDPASAGESQEVITIPTWEVTVAEKARAREIAEANLAKTHPGETIYYVDAGLHRDKTVAARLARVIHYRPEGDVTIYTVVNLQNGEVRHQESNAHVPTSLSHEEFEQAKALVLADGRVKAGLGANHAKVVIEPMLTRTLATDDPAFGHRVIRILFRLGDDYVGEPIALVDLTTKTVTIEPASAAKGGK